MLIERDHSVGLVGTALNTLEQAFSATIDVELGINRKGDGPPAFGRLDSLEKRMIYIAAQVIQARRSRFVLASTMTNGSAGVATRRDTRLLRFPVMNQTIQGAAKSCDA